MNKEKEVRRRTSELAAAAESVTYLTAVQSAAMGQSVSSVQPEEGIELSEVSHFRGLKNLGCTCYLNTLLQALFMTEDFKKAVLNYKSPASDPTKDIIWQLNRLFEQLQENTLTAANPTEVVQCLGIKDVSEQNDLGEYFRLLMNQIARTVPQIQGFLELFRTTQVRTLKCKRCEEKDKQKEEDKDEERIPVLEILVPLMTSENKPFKTLDNALSEIFRCEILTNDNQIYCDSCDQKCDAEMQYYFETLPNILVLQLKKCGSFTTFEDISIPSSLHFSKTDSEKERWHLHSNAGKTKGEPDEEKEITEYDLFVICRRVGGSKSGHYFADIKSSDQWYCFNDACVTQINTPRDIQEERSWRNQLDIFGVLKNYLRSWRNQLDIFGVLKNYLRSWRNQLNIFGVLKNYLRSWRNPLDIFGVLKNYLRSWQNRLDIFGVLKNYLSPPPAYLLMYHKKDKPRKKDMQPDYANDSPGNQSTQLDCDKNKPQKKANYKQEHQKNGKKRQTSNSCLPEQQHNLKKEKRDEQKPLKSREVERENNPDEENQTCKNINPEMTRGRPRTNESTLHTDLPRPSLLEQNQKEKTEQNKVKQKRSQSWPGGMTSRTSRRMTAAEQEQYEGMKQNNVKQKRSQSWPGGVTSCTSRRMTSAEQEQYEGMKQLIVTAIDGEKTTKKQNDTPGNDPNSSPTEHQRASVSDKPDKMDEELQVTNEQNS